MKFKGEGVCANKDLFLMHFSSHEGISPSLLLNGVVVSVPWRLCHEYEVLWDTSSLPLALEKSAIHHSIIKSDKIRLAQLKMTRYTFDELYPDGPEGIVNVGWAPSRKST
jgi:hypothetical protein